VIGETCYTLSENIRLARKSEEKRPFWRKWRDIKGVLKETRCDVVEKIQMVF
jgi:hypothetical protein